MKELNIILISVVMVCFSYQVNGQMWLWASGSTSVYSDQAAEGLSLASDASGNVYISGGFGFDSASVIFGSDTIENLGQYSFYIAKYDASGNIQWARSAGGPNCNVTGYSIAVDPTGNVYATGVFLSNNVIFGSDTLINGPAGENMFLVKYDASGNVLWAKSPSVSSSSYSIGFNVTADLDGNIYLIGDFGGGAVSFDAFTLTPVGGWDIFISKFDSLGNVVWIKSVGGLDNDEGTVISSNQSGDVYLAGNFGPSGINFGNDSLTTSNWYGAGFLAKYDLAGNFVWAKKTDLGVLCMVTDASSHFYLTGQISDTVIIANDTLVSEGIVDMFVAKYDDSGNPLWGKSGGGTDIDVGWGVATDAEGDLLVTGGYNSPLFIIGVDSFLSPGIIPEHDPMFIAKYDRNGNLLCVSTLISGGDDRSAIVTDAYGDAYVGGDFYHANPFIVGSDTLIQSGTEDIFVAKWRCDLESILEINKNEQVTVYPNPVETQLTINLESPANEAFIRVYDLQGRMIVLPTAFINTQAQLNTTDLADGFYTLQIINKRTGERAIGKFVKGN